MAPKLVIYFRNYAVICRIQSTVLYPTWPMKQKIVFLTPYPYNTAPSQRFRFEQYYTLLEQKGYTVCKYSFLSQATWRMLYLPGHQVQKVAGIVAGMLRRVAHLFHCLSAHAVFIHREASPLGPPLFEWILAKVLRKRLIFDYDDAIWLENTSAENRWVASLKNHSKFYQIVKWAKVISAGNAYLANEAKKIRAEQVYINPTTVDATYHKRPVSAGRKEGPIRIGWTGSQSTMQYLDQVQGVLQDLVDRHDVEVEVISNRAPDLQLDKLRFILWDKQTEITQLSRFDIGIMPLTADRWSEGKCGFKVIQYFALGIPVVASPVGVNVELVEPGVNGYLATEASEWYQHLEDLILSAAKRTRLGSHGRKKVETTYSVQGNSANFLRLFDALAT